MAEIGGAKRYDVVILGASGFTGKYVVREALKFLQAPNSPLKSLALAGRSTSRLSQALKWAAAPNPPPGIPLLAADTSDAGSLSRLAAQSRIILNCVGPFRLYGEPVVRACVESGCDYLDVSGEPEFMEKMEAAYHDAAAGKGSLIVSACGFDSIPAELGFFFHSKHWIEPSVPNRIEAYLSLESDKKIVGNFGTYESAVLGVANSDQLMKLRSSRPRRTRPKIPGPAPPRDLFEHQKELRLWALKLPSADSVVVRRTLSTLAENPEGLPGTHESDANAESRRAFWSSVKPAHFGVKIANRSLLGLFPLVVLGAFFALLCRWSLGRRLLLQFPSFFSLGGFRKEGPSEEQVGSASFKMWFVGKGFSDEGKAAAADTEVITRVTGPEIGYVTTPIVLVQCALILLRRRGDLPGGGVYTPGIVFGPTDLRDRLQENGISFDFVSRKAISD
ncbi:hypothetical protein M569_09927 [Genlisea aurea]|uniref:Saccharopine dehydrogenase NADP binding domain-containing protein n=1 Tax=Genlisea aurea TaxID=192259 RepID=S8CJM1_9LAMI|nr:hypothetical protein M569_09927 [Genlisea aurea]